MGHPNTLINFQQVFNILLEQIDGCHILQEQGKFNHCFAMDSRPTNMDSTPLADSSKSCKFLFINTLLIQKMYKGIQGSI
jgi:hypothetical protein